VRDKCRNIAVAGIEKKEVLKIESWRKLEL
jgi:hypothetical protein